MSNPYITEHPTREGRVFCCVVLDACSKMAVGWAIDSSANTALVVNALTMATQRRRTTNETVIHPVPVRQSRCFCDHSADPPATWIPTTRVATDALRTDTQRAINHDAPKIHGITKMLIRVIHTERSHVIDPADWGSLTITAIT
jgi:transposase InsO family protein